MYKAIEERRAAWRRYYQKNTIAFKKRRREKKIRLREIVERLKEVPCPDCNRTYPACAMDFDHVRGEKFNSIALLVAMGYSGVTLQREIQKCEVVCSNCHRIRTYTRRKRDGSLKVKRRVVAP